MNRFLAAQVVCAGIALAGVYLLLGLGATLIITGLVGFGLATWVDYQSGGGESAGTGNAASGSGDRASRADRAT